MSAQATSSKYLSKRKWDVRSRSAVRDGRRRAAGRQRNGRKIHCGAWTLRGEHPIERTTKYLRLNCDCWACRYCGPRKALRYRSNIVRAVQSHRLFRMLTLTLDPVNVTNSDERETFYEHWRRAKLAKSGCCSCPVCTRVQRRAIPHMRECWNKLRANFCKRLGKTPEFICVVEFQKSTGLIHLHVALGRFVEQAWLKHVWQVVGGGQHVDIRYKDPHRAAAYMSKYLSKNLLLSAPEGLRRVTTSRTITLNAKVKDERVWSLLRKQIELLLLQLSPLATQIRKDAEGIVESFTLSRSSPLQS